MTNVAFEWSPGIGDPTIGGWFTVALYLLTAAGCWRTAQSLATSDRAALVSEPLVWRAIALLFLALGINKQLDLQSALTELARVLAHAQGWYENRRGIQVAFIGAVGVICLLAGIALLIMCWHAPPPTWLAAAGACLVLMFVLVRAASFHRVDQFLGESISGLRWNWILEIGGILLVLFAAHRRRRTQAARP